MNTDFVLTCVNYRTRFEAYARVEAMDMNRVRNTFIDRYGDEYASVTEDQLRQELKNMVDIIYTDNEQEIVPGTTQLELDGKVYIFAGGFWNPRGDSPSDEYDTMHLLVECGIDHD